VQLNGEGFELLVAKGDSVTRGQAIVRWNPAEIEAAGKSPVCPVVALEATPDALGDLVEEGEVLAGTQLFLWK
jgi:PTS system N-acetylglucosamine-specific IIA component